MTGAHPWAVRQIVVAPPSLAVHSDSTTSFVPPMWEMPKATSPGPSRAAETAQSAVSGGASQAPGQSPQPDGQQQVVERSGVGMVDPLPEDCDHCRRHDGRDVVDGPVEGAPPDAGAIDQEGQEQADPVHHGEGDQGEQDGVESPPPEDPVPEGRNEVGDPDELDVRRHAVPLGHAERDGAEEGIQAADAQDPSPAAGWGRAASMSWATCSGVSPGGASPTGPGSTRYAVCTPPGSAQRWEVVLCSPGWGGGMGPVIRLGLASPVVLLAAVAALRTVAAGGVVARQPCIWMDPRLSTETLDQAEAERPGEGTPRCSASRFRQKALIPAPPCSACAGRR